MSAQQGRAEPDLVGGEQLWRHPDFIKLWLGQTVSGLGSRFSALALPLVAITALGASPIQLGILTAATGLPWLLLGPLIGVASDRVRRRPALIAADLGRAVLLGTIPILAIYGALRIELLYVIAFLTGLLAACFDVAYQSYLPTLVARGQLIEANSRLSISSSAADVAGPALAGLVIEALGASIAVAVDAGSFMVSALSVKLIRAREPAPAGAVQQHVWAALREGISYLGRHGVLRALAATNVTFMFFFGMAQAVFMLLLTQGLHLSASAIGLIMGLGSAAGLLGALLAGGASRWLGLGPVIILASLLRGLGFASLALTIVLPEAAAPVLVAGCYGIHQFGWSLWAVTQASARQAMAPQRLQGRVTAAFLFLVRGAMPLGALLGGALGEQVGVAPTFAAAGIGLLLATGWLLASPLRGLREPPLPMAEDSAQTPAPA